MERTAERWTTSATRGWQRRLFAGDTVDVNAKGKVGHGRWRDGDWGEPGARTATMLTARLGVS